MGKSRHQRKRSTANRKHRAGISLRTSPGRGVQCTRGAFHVCHFLTFYPSRGIVMTRIYYFMDSKGITLKDICRETCGETNPQEKYSTVRIPHRVSLLTHCLGNSIYCIYCSQPSIHLVALRYVVKTITSVFSPRDTTENTLKSGGVPLPSVLPLFSDWSQTNSFPEGLGGDGGMQNQTA